jgi:hypothetical protein
MRTIDNSKSGKILNFAEVVKYVETLNYHTNTMGHSIADDCIVSEMYLAEAVYQLHIQSAPASMPLHSITEGKCGKYLTSYRLPRLLTTLATPRWAY